MVRGRNYLNTPTDPDKIARTSSPVGMAAMERTQSWSPPAPSHNGGDDRLDSWKEIAAYFNRDVRTVRRWEKQEALPVHRHLHKARGSVFAYRSELQAWWNNGQPRLGAETPATGRHGWLRPLLAAGLGFALIAGAYAVRKVYQPAGPPKRRTVDPTAQELYLKGRYHLNQRAGGREKALGLFEQAIARDPEFAAAHAGLADAYLRMAGWGPLPAPEAWARAESAARRALELDEQLAEAHGSMGMIWLFRHWNWAEAEKEFLRALALDPVQPETHARFAHYLRATGRLEDSIRERTRALELAPLRADLIMALGVEHLFARRHQAALEQFKAALELDTRSLPALRWLAATYELRGMYPEAAAAQLRVFNLEEQPEAGERFRRLYQTKGYLAAARFVDEEAIARFKRRPGRQSWNLAYSYARLGQNDEAFRYLEIAYEERDPGLLQIRVDPDFDNLRADARYHRLVQRIGFPP